MLRLNWILLVCVTLKCSGLLLSFGTGMGGMPGGMHGGMHGGMRRGARKDPPIEQKLPCTLEELYAGCVRKMKISRTVVDASGRGQKQDEILEIKVTPGWKKGTKVTFPEKGK